MKQEISQFCAKIGADPLLVQGAGGNVSWKDGPVLWVKSSGTWLADALKKDIFLPVDYADLQAAIKAGDYDAKPKPVIETSVRPSIETMLHALMPHKIVVHLHAVEVLAYLVRQGGVEEIAAKLGTAVKFVSVGYHKPGAELAEAINEALTGNDAGVVFLKNHGVVIGGNDLPEVERLLSMLVDQLAVNVDVHQYKASGAPSGYIAFEDTESQALAFEDELFQHIKSHWAIYPDHVVFMGARAFCYDDLNEVSPEHELVFVKSSGVFVKDGFSIGKQAQLRCYYDIIRRQPHNAVITTLKDSDIAALLDWDAEHYRMQISKA